MNLAQDLRYAARLLNRSRLFTVTAVLSIAIGIAGNAAIFSVADALLLRAPGGLTEPDRLVDVGRIDSRSSFDTLSYPDYLDYRSRNTRFEELAAFRDGEAFGLGTGSGATRLYGGQVSGNYFAVLGVRMFLGPGLVPDDETRANAVTVISHGLWQSQFEADAQIIGRTIRLNGQPFTIVGVAPEGFVGPGLPREDLWVPLTTYPEDGVVARLSRRDGTWLMSIGRLKPDATLAQARAEMEGIARDLQRDYPASNQGRGIALAPARRISPFLHAIVGGFVGLLFALVGLVLLIACTNVAGMLLARGATRSREIAVRLALGAARERVIRLLITESVLLAIAGAVVGIVGAFWLVALLRQIVPLTPIPIAIDFRLDWRVVVFAVLLSIVAGVLAGLVPALQAVGTDAASAIKGDTASAGPRRLRLRHTFVVAQVAMAVLLLVCALLLTRSLRNAEAIDAGFVTEQVDLAGLELRLAGYNDPVSGTAFAEELVVRAERLPGVVAAASSRVVPLNMAGFALSPLWRPDRPADDRNMIRSDWNVVTPHYFQTLQIPVLRGRAFTAADRAGAADVVIVNETLARQVWPDGEALGRTLLYRRQGEQRPIEVIGIARDAKYRSIGETARPFMYVPLAQHYQSEMWLMVRARDGSVLPAIRSLVREMNPNLPVVQATTLADATAFNLVPSRVAAAIAASVGIVGLLLAGLGIYGITAYGVTRRTREIGIRVALGARQGDVVRMIVRQAMALAGSGGLLGLLGAALAGQLMRGFLYGMQPFDPLSFLGGAALFATLAIVASLIPARRAASLNPVDALRAD